MRGDLLDLFGRKNRVRRVDWKIFEAAVTFDQRWFAGGKKQIGDTFVAANHLPQERVDNYSVHSKEMSSIPAAAERFRNRRQNCARASRGAATSRPRPPPPG